MPPTTQDDPDKGEQHRGDEAAETNTSPASGSQTSRPVRVYHKSRGRRIGDAVISLFIHAGVVPSSYILTTRGRKTGRLRTNPVTIIQRADTRWLVAPYGPVPWVLNARASGRVSLRRGRKRADYTIREVTALEAGPVLKEYLGISKPTRPYFQASLDSPVEEFIAEAGKHPVFELTPAP